MRKENELMGLFPSIEEIPDSFRLKQPVHQKKILVDGQLAEWSGAAQNVYSPIYLTSAQSTESEKYLIGSYPIGTATEATEALSAAVAAYNAGTGEWPSMPVSKRIKCMEEFMQRMSAKKNEIVNLIIWEIGKSAGDAAKEFDRTIDYISETIKAVKLLSNRTSAFEVEQKFIGQTKRVPHGVVLCMGPFNYPLNETFTTLIPALIMGNTILFKPPKQGTLLFEPLLEAFAESFPKGVVNTVYGRGRDIVPELMQSGKVDVLALIGSSKVADTLKKMHPKSNRLKSILGLDAKNAAIILEDADIEMTVKEVVTGALSFNGQRCTALKIIFVHTSISEKFNSRLVEEIDRLVIGMPWTKNVMITPIAEPDKPAYLQECIDDAIAKGAKVLNAISGGGDMYKSLIKPAVVYPVNEQMKLYHEEQFGPIIPVASFDDLSSPVDFVTASPFGQQVSIFGNDTDSIGLLIDMLAGQVGRININSQCQRSPDTFAFNGRKDSAEGTLSVDDALIAFSVHSVVAARQTQTNEEIFGRILSENKSVRLNNTVVF